MRAAVLLLVIGLLAATAAGATELHYGVEVKGIYNSNVFGSSSSIQDDGSFRGTPFFELRDPDGKFRWNLKYDPSYEQYVTLPSASGWDQDVNGGFTWVLDPLVTLNVTDRFGQFHSLTRFNQAVGVPNGGTAGPQRNKFIRNAASASLQIRTTPAQAFTLYGDHYLWAFSGNNRRDQQMMDAGLRYAWAMSKRLTLGSILSWSHQYLASLNVQPSQTTDYYHVGGNVRYVFDPTLNVSLSAGPTLVVPPSAPSPPTSVFVAQPYLIRPVLGPFYNFININSCPSLSDGTHYWLPGVACQFLPGLAFSDLSVYGKTVSFMGPVESAGGNRLTYFASAAISKTWENWDFTLSYQRQADQSAGVGTSSIADIVYGSIGWHPAARWKLYLNASWIRRSQKGSSAITVFGLAANPDGASSNPNAAEIDSLRSLKVSNFDEFDTTNVNAYAGYRLSKRITIFGFGGYSRYVNSGKFFQTTRTNIFTFWTGIRYEFEPIHF